MKRSMGFTLIELLAVIILLAVILVITVPAIKGLIETSKLKSFEANASTIIKAVENRNALHDGFDCSTITVDNIKDELGIDNNNYEFVSIYLVNGKVNIDIVGKNKWAGLEVHGTRNNFTNDSIMYAYEYTGDYQVFKAPSAGDYRIQLWGAGGGRGRQNGKFIYSGGTGSYTTGVVFLEKDAEIYIYVGGVGADSPSNSVGGAGGYNGGGTGGSDDDDEGSGGGGGATDIRLVNGSWDAIDSLRSRIMVAAGGGGSTYGSVGGSGGNLMSPAICSSPGATQTTGYLFGVGEMGHDYSYTPSSGAGGGYYGGQSERVGTGGCQSGSGGSSFISGYNGCDAMDQSGVHTGQPNHYSGIVFKDMLMIDGKSYMPGSDGIEEKGHSGNGYAEISKVITQQNIFRFDYTGTPQTYKVPIAGRYKIQLWGASGGRGRQNGAFIHDGGAGSYVEGTVYLNKDVDLYMYVGGVGLDSPSNSVGGAGGYNGGGTGGSDTDDEGTGGGGGATDIRLVNGFWDNVDSLRSRIMVAAGGGGSTFGSAGGAGGNTISSPICSSNSATQTTGYFFGIGQTGTDYGYTPSSGAGGGYYGGFSGFISSSSQTCQSASGGSSFVSGCTGCDAIDQTGIHTAQNKHYSNYSFNNIIMASGSETMPGIFESTKTGHYGNGYIIISYLP